MTAVSDDNFGFWNLKEPEEQAFFDHVQSQSLPTICRRCERPVRLMPTKTLCASCISALESGAPASISEYVNSELSCPVLVAQHMSASSAFVLLWAGWASQRLVHAVHRRAAERS